MTHQANFFKRPAFLITVLVVLFATHLFGFWFLRHRVTTAALASGLVVFAIVYHLGMLAPLFALLKRRRAPGKDS